MSSSSKGAKHHESSGDKNTNNGPGGEPKSILTQPIKRSVIQIYGTGLSECGYCKSTVPSSFSYGVVSNYLLAEDYQALMLTGWRRSGTYFYKPIMYATCCPAYPIRLDVNTFSISKQQRQVLRRMERFISSGRVTSTAKVDSVELPPTVGSYHPTIGDSNGANTAMTMNNTGPGHSLDGAAAVEPGGAVTITIPSSTGKYISTHTL